MVGFSNEILLRHEQPHDAPQRVASEHLYLPENTFPQIVERTQLVVPIGPGVRPHAEEEELHQQPEVHEVKRARAGVRASDR